MLIRVQDGGQPARTAQTEVTVNVIRNFNSPIAFSALNIDIEISEVQSQGSVIVDLDARDLDRRVCLSAIILLT